MRFDEELGQFVFEYHGLIFAWDEEPERDYMEQVKTISEKYNAQLDSIIEFMMPDITATFGDFSTDVIKEKLGKPVINYDNGFARAAEILKITQSAVSRQIHSLEDELGTKLLHRTTRTVTLTPAGISFLEDAKNVMGRLDVARQKIQRHQNTNIQVLTIGCQNEANLDLLCKILKTCREQMPQLYPFLKVIPHRSILNLFYQDELDLLFGFQDDIPIRNDTIYKELFQIPLCCIVPASHPYAARPELAKEELYLENMVVCNSYAIPSKVAEIQHQISQHMPPESTYMCENLQVLLTLVRAGYGCSVLPQMNFINSDICTIPLTDSEPLSYGVFSKKSSQSPLLEKFISIVTNTSYS